MPNRHLYSSRVSYILVQLHFQLIEANHDHNSVHTYKYDCRVIWHDFRTRRSLNDRTHKTR